MNEWLRLKSRLVIKTLENPIVRQALGKAAIRTRANKTLALSLTIALSSSNKAMFNEPSEPDDAADFTKRSLSSTLHGV